MITATSGKNELLAAIDEAASQMAEWALTLNEHQLNAVPYANSWTPAQLVRHVTKSIDGMAGAISMPAQPAPREAWERISELKAVFLDFSHKMKSPDMIVPEAGPYEKQAVNHGLKTAVERLKDNIQSAHLTDLVTGLPFGPITKLEIVHFVLYHTQRHVHQMKKMDAALRQ